MVVAFVVARLLVLPLRWVLPLLLVDRFLTLRDVTLILVVVALILIVGSGLLLIVDTWLLLVVVARLLIVLLLYH